ncbi:unnamed protein product [Camellia sinensis]
MKYYHKQHESRSSDNTIWRTHQQQQHLSHTRQQRQYPSVLVEIVAALSAAPFRTHNLVGANRDDLYKEMR